MRGGVRRGDPPMLGESGAFRRAGTFRGAPEGGARGELCGERNSGAQACQRGRHGRAGARSAELRCRDPSGSRSRRFVGPRRAQVCRSGDLRERSRRSLEKSFSLKATATSRSLAGRFQETRNGGEDAPSWFTGRFCSDWIFRSSRMCCRFQIGGLTTVKDVVTRRSCAICASMGQR